MCPVARGAHGGQARACLAIGGTVHTVNVLDYSDLGGALSQALVHVEELLGHDLHARVAHLGRLGTGRAGWLALVARECCLILEFYAHTALLHTGVALQVRPLVAFGAPSAAVRALQTVRVTPFAHVLLWEIVARAFFNALVVQKQAKFRLRVTRQAFTWGVGHAFEARVVTVSCDCQSTLGIKHLVPFLS